MGPALRTDSVRDPQTSHWHLDKRLNVGIIVALLLAVCGLLVNSASVLWWASSFSSRTETRLENAERRLTYVEELQRKMVETQAALASQVAAHAATNQQLAQLMAKIDSRVDQLYRPSVDGR